MDERLHGRVVVIAGGRRRVTVASSDGEHAANDCSVCRTSKGSVRMLTKAVGREAGPHGISVNAVAPGCVRTVMSPMADPEEERHFAAEASLGRVEGPEVAADVVLWLASDRERCVSSKTLFINGGWVAR